MRMPAFMLCVCLLMSCDGLTPIQSRAEALVWDSVHFQRCEKIADRPSFFYDRSEGVWYHFQFGNNMPERFDTWGHLRINPILGRIEYWDFAVDGWVNDDIRELGP